MRDATLALLRQEFGAPASQSAAMCCWHLSPRFDMAAERLGAPDHGCIWIPWDPHRHYLGFGEVYLAGRPRPDDAVFLSCRSLERSRTVLCLRVRWLVELEVAVNEIRLLAVQA